MILLAFSWFYYVQRFLCSKIIPLQILNIYYQTINTQTNYPYIDWGGVGGDGFAKCCANNMDWEWSLHYDTYMQVCLTTHEGPFPGGSCGCYGCGNSVRSAISFDINKLMHKWDLLHYCFTGGCLSLTLRSEGGGVGWSGREGCFDGGRYIGKS